MSDRNGASTSDAIGHWLREHPVGVGARTQAPVFLSFDPLARGWLVRWPGGSVKWESETSLMARLVPIPDAPLFPMTAVELEERA